MRTWKKSNIAMGLVLILWGCGMAEVNVLQPKPLDGMKEVAASGDMRKLDAEVSAFLRDQFAIASARYFQANDVPWIAISKSVRNQMAEKSIQPTMFKWYEPGLDLIEVYSQGKEGRGFAVAMPRGANPNGEKLVGYYVLSAPPAAKK